MIDEKRSINIKKIRDIYLGCTSTDVMRKNKVPLEFDSNCFSIKTDERTLDLKCDSSKIRT